MWEPTYDAAMWDTRKELHLFVQRVGQGQGAGVEDDADAVARTAPRRGSPQLLAPGVVAVQNFQSVAASFVSTPLGFRQREPAAVFESATDVGSTVPSTRLTEPSPGSVTAVSAPS